MMTTRITRNAAVFTTGAMLAFSPNAESIVGKSEGPTAGINTPQSDVIHGAPPSVSVFRFNGQPMKVLPSQGIGIGSKTANIYRPNEPEAASNQRTCIQGILANAGIRVQYRRLVDNDHDEGTVRLRIPIVRTEDGENCSRIVSTRLRVRFLDGDSEKDLKPNGNTFKVDGELGGTAENTARVQDADRVVGLSATAIFRAAKSGKRLRTTEAMIAVAQPRSN